MGQVDLQSLKVQDLAPMDLSDLATVLVYAAGAGIMSLVVPISVQALVNTISFGNLLQPIVWLSALMLVLLVIASVFRLLHIWTVEKLQRRWFVRIAFAWTKEPVPAHDIPKFLEISALQKAAAGLLTDGATLALQVSVSLLLLAAYHPWFLFFDVLVIVGILTLIRIPLSRGHITALAESDQKYEVLDEFYQQNGSTPPARARRERIDSVLEKYLSARQKHFRILFLQHVGALSIQVFFSAMLLGLGGWLVIGKQLSLGQLVAAELVITTALAGVAKLGKSLENYYDLRTSFHKLAYGWGSK